jgi:hypothetical protein
MAPSSSGISIIPPGMRSIVALIFMVIPLQSLLTAGGTLKKVRKGSQ